jgi:aspartyl-tRNA(Asn)/glutamyl-tRNA(Gln) amidotransferase subunit C
MQISRDEAKRIADLAHLEFDEAGLARMAAEMTAILTYIDQLREVEGEGAEEAGDAATPLRDDVVREGVDREAVARNAPAWRDGHFVVPKVIGGD